MVADVACLRIGVMVCCELGICNQWFVVNQSHALELCCSSIYALL